MNERWISVKERKPTCSRKPDSFGVPVLVYPPFDGFHQAFYGCRVTNSPEFYLFGAVFHPTHWRDIPKPPKDHP